MITLYGDESNDEHTYAVGGWLITPSHYELFEDQWRTMLGTIAMPDGSPCRAFHASLMMNQRGRFKGWTKDQAFDAFSKATDVVAHRPGRYAMWPCAVAAEIPEEVKGPDLDAIWLILFMKFFALVLQTFPASAGISFVFDKKHNVEDAANKAYTQVTRAIASEFPDAFLEEMTFLDDDGSAGVQAADLLLYEWRKLITDRQNPGRPNREWFQRIRSERPKGALVRFDIGQHIRERNAVLDPSAQVRRMLFGNEVGRE